MYKKKRLGPLRTVAIRNSEVGRYSGGVNVQYERQNKSVPEVASAIWSESAIGGSTVYMYNYTSTFVHKMTSSDYNKVALYSRTPLYQGTCTKFIYI